MATSSTSEIDPSKDPNRKPKKSSDPGWKYAFWSDLSKKDVTQCTRCGKVMHGGIGRLKRHLIGGYPDVTKCSNTTTDIIKEMKAYREKRVGNISLRVVKDGYNECDDEISRCASNILDTETSSSKRQKTLSFTSSKSKSTKTVVSMIRKSPEEVIEERHSKGPYQTTMENSTKSAEEKQKVKQHIANFFYENGIPFNAANSRSYEIMVEAIGQFGSGLKPPTSHELRMLLLENASQGIDNRRKPRRGAVHDSCSLHHTNSLDMEIEEDVTYTILDVDSDYGLTPTSTHESSDHEENGLELDDDI